MKHITDVTLATQLKSLAHPRTAPVQQIGDKFAEALKASIAGVNQAQITADRAAENIVAGDTKNLHEAMIRLEEADISLRMMVQVRNKAVEAYQEVMRMQV
ncbi:flagellar hook-basal body complex protein FliE [Pelobacter sp. M08fum]|uniref:Flagellar hook-basal body complex protein FliE n=2 Tax=Pelovirga terrestris TaxID=2771352 RepID=A0A8J6UGV1_9BACT|nr:flagellar hook-basal body complex protein FliE [Pelovirga terrestris]